MWHSFTKKVVCAILIFVEVIDLSKDELQTKLLSDLSVLGLPVDEVDLLIRPYSKNYYGRYFPVYNDQEAKPRVFIYPYIDENNENLMNYEEILDTSVHEFCHHKQYTDPSFVRLKGVMHNPQFWRLYNHYMNRARKYGMLGGECCDKVFS